MSDKKFVCQLDKRRFRTEEALKQHKIEKHGVAQKATVAPRKSRGGKSQSQTGAVVALPQMVKSSPTDVARMSGTDRLFSLQITAQTAPSTLLANLLVSPELFKRLAMVAHAYQRVRYMRLRFRMEPQLPTSTAGGYVLGFVSDPDDDGLGHTLDTLTAQRGSVTTKWWQSSVVEPVVNNRLFFTHKGVENREYSPGRLLLMVDGSPTVSGNFTIFCEWTAELTVATLDTAACPGPAPGPQPTPGLPNNCNALWTTGGNGRVQVRKGAAYSHKATDIIAEALPGDYWTLPCLATKVIDQNHVFTGNTLYIKDANTVYLADGATVDESATSVQAPYQLTYACRAAKKTSVEEEESGSRNRIEMLEEQVDKLVQALALMTANQAAASGNN